MNRTDQGFEYRPDTAEDEAPPARPTALALEAWREELQERQRGKRRRRMIVWVLLLAVGGGALYLLRPPQASTQDLAQGREAMVKLAAHAVATEVARHGRPPDSVAQVLPAAAPVRMEAVPGGIQLTLDGTKDQPPLTAVVPVPVARVEN